MEFEKKKKKKLRLIFIGFGEIFRFVTYEKMNEMRIKESLFLSLSFSLSLVYRRDLFVVVGKDILSCLNKQRKRKVLIRYDTMRCDALRCNCARWC